MRAFRDNPALRAAAWLLLLASLCAGAFFGQQALFAAAYTWNGDWTTTTAFEHMRVERNFQVRDCLQYMADLEQPNLNYVEREQYASWLEGTRAALSPEHTNFRYEVLSDDGSEVSFSNLEEDKGSLEEQVSQVFYGTVEIQDGSVHFGESPLAGQAWAQADQGVASPSSTLESGVLRYGILRPEHFTAQDEFSDLYALCTAYGARFSLYGGLCAVFGALALLALGPWSSCCGPPDTGPGRRGSSSPGPTGCSPRRGCSSSAWGPSCSYSFFAKNTTTLFTA